MVSQLHKNPIGVLFILLFTLTLGITDLFGENEGDDYSFILLGDTHYDCPGHHDMTWLNKNYPQCEKEVESYCRITKNELPKLVKTVQDEISGDSSLAFIIQTGDIVEGLCGSYELASLQFRDAVSYFDNAFPKTPFYTVKGNHEINSPDASKAYDDVMIKWIAEQTRQQLSTTSYTVKYGPDLFVFFDYYKHFSTIDWVKAALENNTFRYVFFVVHQPVVPNSALSNWTLYFDKKDSAKRMKLLNLLGKYHAIVLSGHVHCFSLVQRTTDTGFFTEICTLSVLDKHTLTPEYFFDSINDYGPGVTEYRPSYKPELELRKNVLAAEKPFIKTFYHSNIAGFSKIKVSENGIELEVHIGSDKQLWKTFKVHPQ